MVHPNELRKCIIEIDEVWHELSQQQRNERLRQECADVRELMAGLRAIHTFYEKNEGMITGN